MVLNQKEEKDHMVPVKDAVHKLQLHLLQGLQDKNLLFSAGSLISRADYEDVVAERSIANLCGYPLCTNYLPHERPRKGRYRISLKEHKVYDLHETYMHCSSTCVVNSQVFASGLQEERCWGASPAKIDKILKLFGDLGLEFEGDLINNVNLGLSNIKIQENTDARVRELSVPDWIGSSNAIEGYVPQSNRTAKPLQVKTSKNESKAKCVEVSDFMSTIVTEDEYSISRTPGSIKAPNETILDEFEGTGQENGCDGQLEVMETASNSLENNSFSKPRLSEFEKTQIFGRVEVNTPKLSLNPCENMEAKAVVVGEKSCQSCKTTVKSSLKSMDVKKAAFSITWADEKPGGPGSRNLCEILEIRVEEESYVGLNRADVINDNKSAKIASAEACAVALCEATKVVASRSDDVGDAVSEAGLVIWPHVHEMEDGADDVFKPKTAPPTWHEKSGALKNDFFDYEDSWYDTPPNEFSLTLSPFATMWNALFSWTTSWSLAYIYGYDESGHEDFLLVNGREYSRKIILLDGRSSEIKQTVSGCLARALPGLVTDLRLPTPLSILEQRLGHLLETMCFVDAVPPFRMKQWRVMGLVFIEALSVCRLPALCPHMNSGRLLLHKVLEDADMSVEEYETMKEVMLPLGQHGD